MKNEHGIKVTELLSSLPAQPLRVFSANTMAGKSQHPPAPPGPPHITATCKGQSPSLPRQPACCPLSSSFLPEAPLQPGSDSGPEAHTRLISLRLSDGLQGRKGKETQQRPCPAHPRQPMGGKILQTDPPQHSPPRHRHGPLTPVLTSQPLQGVRHGRGGPGVAAQHRLFHPPRGATTPFTESNSPSWSLWSGHCGPQEMNQNNHRGFFSLTPHTPGKWKQIIRVKANIGAWFKRMIHRETYIKPTMRYQLTPVGLAITKKARNSKCW